MKKRGVLNAELSQVIASMGHKDCLTVCDSGLPIPISLHRVDLAVSEGVPSFIEVVSAIAEELEVEKIILAEELRKSSPSIIKRVKEIFDSTEIEFIPHESFKKLSDESKAIVRSGETTPYANIILISGVIF